MVADGSWIQILPCCKPAPRVPFGFEHVLQLGVVNRTFTQGARSYRYACSTNGGTEERDGLVQTFHAVPVGNGGLHGHGGVLDGSVRVPGW